MNELTNKLHPAAELDAANLQNGRRLRALGNAELARLGEESLREHLVNMAIVAHSMYAPFSGDLMDSFLNDRNLVRYPVELVYGIGTMALHQFAQPELHNDRYKLFLHPLLEGREDDPVLAVAYFVPVINYGSLINDDHCLLYGATLCGMTTDAYYAELCRIADMIGALPRDRSIKGDRF